MKKVQKALAGLGMLVLATVAAAQPWPSKPIRYVVPFAAGGTTDVLARMLQPELQKALGVAIVIDNKPGAGGNIGSDIVAKAAPDGYTIGGGTVSSHAINVSLYGTQMPYDPVKDFAPIALIATIPNVLVVNPSVPATNVKELIAYMKANPGKLSFASAGNGTSQHISGEMFKSMAGVDMQHIPYKGSAPGIMATLAGEVQMMFDNATIAIPHIKSGRLRALGITTAQRSAALPDVPTIADAGGLTGYAIGSWQGAFAPAGTPPEIVKRLHDEIAKILKTPEMQKRLSDLGSDPGNLTSEEFGALVKSDIVKFGEVVKKSGARID
jgi:tripartite-type tricarboxylate transporter receptor subunit TctC